MKRVGRPPQLDPETGQTMAKSLVNVTIPTKLAEFLKRKNINRSKLFTKIVSDMYKGEICPKCYGLDVQETIMGWFCMGHCGLGGAMPNCYKQKECQRCSAALSPFNLAIDDSGIIVGEKCCQGTYAKSKL